MDITCKRVDVDLSILLRLPPRLYGSERVELKMVEYYSFYQNYETSIYRRFSLYLLERILGTRHKIQPRDIYTFIKPSLFNNVVLDYNNKLDLIIVNRIPYKIFDNILFYEIKERTEDRFIVTFTVIISGGEYGQDSE